MEVYSSGKWTGVADLSKEIERNYDAFSVLFGVTKSNLIPLGHRGKPISMSDEMKKLSEGYPKEYICWYIWSEIKTLEFNNRSVIYPVYDTEIYLKTEAGSEYKGTKEIPDLISAEEYDELLQNKQFDTERYI